jgi:hypothetical protein
MKPDDVPFVALPAYASEGIAFTCGLCGNRFTHGGLVCGTCPMQTGCALVRCPNCGFQFPRSSRIADFVAHLWWRLRRKS